MGAFMAGIEKASERVEMLTRVIAETGMKRLFRKVHQLHRMYPDIASTVKLRGEWVDVAPTDWRERLDMSVNVGLGFNNKQQVVAMAMQLLQIQKEAMQIGMAGKEELFNTVEKLINAISFGEVSQYFIEPGSERDMMMQQQAAEQAQNQPPDPAMIVAQSQAQANQLDAQTKAQKAQVDAQLEAKKQEDATAIRMAELENERLKMEQEARAKEFEIQKWEIENNEKVLDGKAKRRLTAAQTIKALEEAEAAQPGEQVDADFEYDDESGTLRYAGSQNG